MEQEIFDESEYLKRFNQGYLIASFMPYLSKDLAASGNAQPLLHGKGFNEGIRQYNLESGKSNVPSWLKPDRLDFKSQDKEPRNIDKDIE